MKKHDPIKRSAKQIIKIYLEDTPLSSDPSNAVDFYAALGTMVVAWGRLDGHFTSTLLLLMGGTGPDSKGNNILDNSLGKRIKKWRELFNSIDDLGRTKKSAIIVADKMNEISLIRNFLLHSMWQDFTDEKTLSMEVINFKHLPKTSSQLEISIGTINVEYINKVTASINQLNLDMIPISIDVKGLYGRP